MSAYRLVLVPYGGVLITLDLPLKGDGTGGLDEVCKCQCTEDIQS